MVGISSLSILAEIPYGNIYKPLGGYPKEAKRCENLDEGDNAWLVEAFWWAQVCHRLNGGLTNGNLASKWNWIFMLRSCVAQNTPIMINFPVARFFVKGLFSAVTIAWNWIYHIPFCQHCLTKYIGSYFYLWGLYMYACRLYMYTWMCTK